MHRILPRWSAVSTACLYTLTVRLLPYALRSVGVDIDPTLMTWPWNFSPALALCLYGGATLPSRTASLVTPLGIYLASDLGIWALTQRIDWAFYPAQWAVYLALVLTAVGGWMLRSNHRWLRVLSAAILAPWGFFLLTNFACWVGNENYSQTPAGLLACYAAGLLHQRNLIVATVVFSGILFSPLGVREAGASLPRQPLPETA
ncbi:MAG: hypothetical protein KDA75_18315 [Planctomycetaceae bacterium]|nr:hypothetical protein [Planctomycetaceae bacterium]